MDIGQGLVSSRLSNTVDICLVGNLKEAKINGSKDQKGWEEKEKKNGKYE